MARSCAWSARGARKPPRCISTHGVAVERGAPAQATPACVSTVAAACIHATAERGVGARPCCRYRDHQWGGRAARGRCGAGADGTAPRRCRGATSPAGLPAARERPRVIQPSHSTQPARLRRPTTLRAGVWQCRAPSPRVVQTAAAWTSIALSVDAARAGFSGSAGFGSSLGGAIAGSKTRVSCVDSCPGSY